MEIITFSKTQLQEALRNNTLWNDNDVVPISSNKALLFINNPHASDNDILLLLAKDSNRTVGYRAMWPDYIVSNGEKHKVAWGSCYWVDPNYRGKGIGASLLEKSYELYNERIGSLSQSEMAARVYDGADKYYRYAETEGVQFMVRSNFTYWVKKKYFKNKVLLLPLNILDAFLNLFVRLKQSFWSRKNKLDSVNLEYLTEIYDNELVKFIEKHNKKDLTPKSRQELNNIIKNPTSLATPFFDNINSRYFFNTVETSFYYLYLKITDKHNNIIGFICLNIDGKKLYTPFIYTDEKYSELISNIVCHHIKKLKIEIYLTYYSSIIKNITSNRFPIVFKRKFIRKSYLSAIFNEKITKDLFIHDGDGA